MTQKIYDAIIIGSGIAGMTAAIYLKRENLNILVIEKEMPGGQLVKSPLIENYPGYESVEGPALALKIHKQVTDLEVPFAYEDVLEIVDEKFYKIVRTHQNVYQAKTVLLAMGRSPRKMGLEKENSLYGRGISYCATCDGAFYKNKDVAVVGGGNSALIEAIFLANICRKVYVIHRRDTLRGESTRGEALSLKENVEILYETTVEALQSDAGRLTGLTLSNGESLSVEGLFVYIGFIPNTKMLTNTSIKREKDYVIVDSKMETSMKGVYACGDVIYKDVYQLTTAAGEATIAAESIKKTCLIGEKL